MIEDPLDVIARVQTRALKHRRRRGLGDVIAAILHPFVRFSDRFFKTKLENCSPCARRRKTINQKAKWLNSIFRVL